MRKVLVELDDTFKLIKLEEVFISEENTDCLVKIFAKLCIEITANGMSKIWQQIDETFKKF